MANNNTPNKKRKIDKVTDGKTTNNVEVNDKLIEDNMKFSVNDIRENFKLFLFDSLVRLDNSVKVGIDNSLVSIKNSTETDSEKLVKTLLKSFELNLAKSFEPYTKSVKEAQEKYYESQKLKLRKIMRTMSMNNAYDYFKCKTYDFTVLVSKMFE